MAKKSVKNLDVTGKRVLLRADLNVPLNDGTIADDRRIRMFLPTLQDVINRGGRAIVMSHLGRPSGDPAKDAEFSLKPVANRLSELLNKDVRFMPHLLGDEPLQAANAMNDGDVMLLENLRFHPGEKVIDKAKKNADGKLTADQESQRNELKDALVRLADLYVNDAFGTCHRKHVSMYDVPQALPDGTCAVGYLVEKEIRYLSDALEDPQRPFVAILGGAKVSDKIGVINNLLSKVDKILIGGAMTYTFYAAQGKNIGKSLCEHDKTDVAKELLAAGGDKIVLPVDSNCAPEFGENQPTTLCDDSIPDHLMGLDIGPKSIANFSDIIASAKTIVWNGPVGAFENKPFDKGTFAVADAIAKATANGATSIIGGGDSAAAIEQAGLAEKVSHVSTGGGASLQFLEGKEFAALNVLDDA